jgi:hypothetical protein
VKRTMKEILLKTLVGLIMLALAVYLIDYAILRYRMFANRNPYGIVEVRTCYAIHEKNGKIEYGFLPPHTERFVNSLFPHAGVNPGWYERRHTKKAIEI